MKRWLKRHGKWCIVALGLLFITNSSYGLATREELGMIIWNICLITVWLIIVLVASGALTKFFAWWNKN